MLTTESSSFNLKPAAPARSTLPRFLRMAAHRLASVFLWLWLGHIYMGSKGFAKHSPRSPNYGETLAHCTRAVYPPQISPDGGMLVGQQTSVSRGGGDALGGARIPQKLAWGPTIYG
jgi:hypothetical protein